MKYIYENQNFEVFDYAINQNPSNSLFIKNSNSFFDISEIVSQKGLEEILTQKEIITDDMYISLEKAHRLGELVPPQLTHEDLLIPHHKPHSWGRGEIEYAKQGMIQEYAPISHVPTYSELLQKESNEKKKKNKKPNAEVTN